MEGLVLRFNSLSNLEKWVEELFVTNGIDGEMAVYLRLLIFLFVLLIISSIAFLVTKHIILNFIYRFVRSTKIKWDDMLVDNKVFGNLAHTIPAVIVSLLAPTIFRDFESVLPFITKVTNSYLIIVGTAILISFLKIVEIALASQPSFKDKPMASYFQLVRIILYLGTGVLILSILLGKSPIYFLSAFGAMTAVLLLVFKDTILGLVASVQISSNDMVRVGDWVEMPKFNADGDVIAINLNTVKVQNWDKTYTTIPTYYFITDSFKNWRGMVESGGRRIKRSIYINSQTIRFVDPETRASYKKFNLISDYISRRQKEIEEFNSENQIDTSVLINGRRMTNIGVFRKYVESYLKSHPRIKQDMTIMVRQLAIEDRGVPLEIYCFTNTTAWVEYESIQADIFDHVLSAAGFFGLEIFQQPTGKDIQKAVEHFAQLSRLE
ncbi:MAG: mechanosensitive ion channel family protein [Bacteroidales bacterium]|nr:mechanosensitive ion channel family protein [Bacteroidales bacterium]OJX88316.1 MAG: mechanosensitive ion channel protein MscS [Paludibacter sp. 47-17]